MNVSGVTPSPSTSSRRPVYALSGEGLDALEKEVIALFVDLARMLGLPPSYGEIYGLLYTATRPLSFTDIHERLTLSKGAVSIGLQALRTIGAVRPADDGPDWRREHFVAETELRTLMAAFLRNSIEPQLKEGMSRLETIKTDHQAALAGTTDDAVLFRERIERLHAWHRRGATVLPMISKFLG
jgi:HTH-type transcriptional regulator, glycine betaine synthesis regulator